MKHNSPIKEQSLNPQKIGHSPVAPIAETTGPEELDERVVMALHAAADKKAIDPVVLDLREIASFTDFFLIASGANERQVQAISDEISEKLKHAGTPPIRVEGYQTAEWILHDYGDFVVHVFADKARRFYDLERLWREARQVQLPADIASTDPSSFRSDRD